MEKRCSAEAFSSESSGISSPVCSHSYAQLPLVFSSHGLQVQAPPPPPQAAADFMPSRHSLVSVLFVAFLPFPSVALSPPHAKPFLRKLVFMWVRTEMQILAEQLKTQYWRGENVCQGENRTCWLAFQVQVKTGPLNQTSPRRVCFLPTLVNL